MVARVFDEGKAVKRDVGKARQLLDPAVALGSIEAMGVKGFDLIHGRGREMNRDEGMKLLQKAAGLGNLNAKNELAREYLSGQALDTNYVQTFEQLEWLATKDSAIGLFWLSQLATQLWI